MITYISDLHKDDLRKFLSNKETLKNLMAHFPKEPITLKELSAKEFKFITYATGLDYRDETMKELLQFLKEEGHLYYDGDFFYSLD